MIKTERGDSHIKGTGSEILADLAVTIKHIRKILADEYGDEFAKEQIVLAGRLAFMTKDELAEKKAELMDDELQ